MKQLLLPLFIMLLSLSQPQVAAQRMTISQPLDGAVYQQNGQGTGRVIIRGDFNSRSFLLGTFYILVGRLQKLDLVNGQPTADSPIQFPLRQQRTTFAQEVTVPKGWYQLTITAQKIAGGPFGPRTVTSSVKVGVGEVFIIAGQSNAEGGHRVNGDSGPFVLATNTNLFRMDAVRVIDQATGQQDWRNYPNDYKEVKQLTSTKTATQIGPRGRSLWYWASVGGQLAQDCGVPVAFFNAGFGGTTITQWATSTNPKAQASGQYNVANRASRTADRYGPGAPYGFFGNMLGLYASTYGIRAVLWMQGENDTKAIIQKDEQVYAEGWADRPLFEENNPNKILPLTNAPNEPDEKLWVRNSGEYAAKLRVVIAKSRTEILGKTVPWVISQTSYIGANPNRRDLDNGGVSSALVRGGQSTGAIGLTGLYQMANTDDLLSNYRLLVGSDFPVHFNATGAEIVAGRWADALKDICRNNRLTPITQQDLDTEPREIVISESGQDLIAPAGYAGYKWLSGGPSFDLNAYFSETQAISAPSARSIQTKDGTQIASSYKSAGTFQVVLQNSNGLPILTQSLDLPYLIVDDTQDNPPTDPSSGQTCKNGNEASGGNRTPNGATVGGFGNSSEFMEYTFTGVAAAGDYTFSIHYASGDATAGIDLVVNGTPYQLRPPGTASWTPNADASRTISLIGGTNTIRIQGADRVISPTTGSVLAVVVRHHHRVALV